MWLWDSRTHQKIVSLALQKCNDTFVNLLKVHQELFILGIEAPDRIFKDFTNHYYNCTPNDFGYHSGRVITKIGKEIVLIERMLRNPDEIILHENMTPFLAAILTTPLKALIFEMGVLSHYIADLHQPLHTDGKYRFEDEETVHKILEADTRLHLDDFHIKLERRHRIKEPLSFFTYQIYKINSFYDELIDRYFLEKGKVKPDRWENSREIIETCISLAAMNIANVFLGFENKINVFKKQRNYFRTIQKVNKHTSYKKSYRIRKYKTGSILLRINRNEN